MLAEESDPELALLGDDPRLGESDFAGDALHGIENAPIFTGDAVEAVDPENFPQRALYGRILATSTGDRFKSPKLYINTNAPFSGVVCGVQGSGKSHSTSVLLESCLICDKRLGTLPKPLSALLFHYDTTAGSGDVPPCEAAYLASLDEVRGGEATPPKVTVLVLPTNLTKMRRVYAKLPNVKVEPLHFASDDISGERLLAMMKVDQNQHMPLYMESILAILRSSIGNFSYDDFRRQLDEQKFSPGQKMMLNLRLKILDSCLDGGDMSNRLSNHFKEGQLTIIDLSSPFMDGTSACGFFDIILGLFIEAKMERVGKLVVLDEAHKYLNKGEGSSHLTDSLLSVIRQQRHLGTRVLISTQEPTVVPPEFLDLCSIVIAHRFSSPNWLDHLKGHISTVDTQWCENVVTLRTGEAMIFSPMGLILRQVFHIPDGSLETGYVERVAPLGQGYLKVRSRKRITKDGGRSILATDRVEPSRTPPRFETASIGTTPDSELYFSQPKITKGEHLNNMNQASPCAPLLRPARSGLSPDADAWRQWISNSDARSGNISTPVLLPRQLGANEWEKSDSRGESSSSVALFATDRYATTSTRRARAQLEERFRPLIMTLERKKHINELRVPFSVIGDELKRFHPAPYSGKLQEFLNEAAEAGLIEIGNVGIVGKTPWVRLPSFESSSPSFPREYAPLVRVMQELRAKGEGIPAWGVVADELHRTYPGLVSTKFKIYVSGAVAAGVVRVRKGQKLELAVE